jgi:hypothetical protein
MLSNLNHDHGRKKKFETWKEKIEKKYGRLKTKIPRSDLYVEEEGLSCISAILWFSRCLETWVLASSSFQAPQNTELALLLHKMT